MVSQQGLHNIIEEFLVTHVQQRVPFNVCAVRFQESCIICHQQKMQKLIKNHTCLAENKALNTFLSIHQLLTKKITIADVVSFLSSWFSFIYKLKKTHTEKNENRKKHIKIICVRIPANRQIYNILIVFIEKVKYNLQGILASKYLSWNILEHLRQRQEYCPRDVMSILLTSSQ